MKRNLLNLGLFIFGVTYIFAPISGMMKSEKVYAIEKKSEPEVIKTPEPTIAPFPTARPKEAEKPNAIEDEIRLVFGEHADKAMLLLKGRGAGTCAENRGLNPDAINTNSDGSKDWGVFQINDHWHGFNKAVNNKRYLTDPAINIRIAWRLFETSGYSFKLWTCGKAYGI